MQGRRGVTYGMLGPGNILDLASPNGVVGGGGGALQMRGPYKSAGPVYMVRRWLYPSAVGH